MSIELIQGEEGYLRFAGDETTTYRELLDLAQKHGWEPLGTIGARSLHEDGSYSEEDPDWDGNYVTNDWQSVTKEDAGNLAEGLEKAGPQGDRYKECFRKKLIAFCREGAFHIG